MSTLTTTLDTFAPAHAMLAALRDRRISSKGLVELHLEQIGRHNAALNAIVVPASDPRAAAEQADAARNHGDARPLLGLPVTLKESMNVSGLPTTVGVPDFADFRAGDFGAVPQHVLDAGAVLLAPITLRTAFPHIDLPWPPLETPGMITLEVDGQQHPYVNQLVYPALATLTGQPATAFPVGLSGAGMPIGLQAIGPYLEDYTPIRFAALAAQEMGGFARPPGYEVTEAGRVEV
jgi:Asp-tRNA(Asn)/Glu-tRNA(Gln) amidotransferase A subunit family amidase